MREATCATSLLENRRGDFGGEAKRDRVLPSSASGGLEHAAHQPQQNCFVERFNGTMRSEVLNVEDFETGIGARVVLKQWSLEEYNDRRPHRGHGMC